MPEKITSQQKELALEAIREFGTMIAAAKVAGVSKRVLNKEMARSEIFKKRVLEAREEGRRNLADNAIQLIKDYADGNCSFCHGNKTLNREVCPHCKGTGLIDKTDRNRLTAAIALANAYEAGFRGTTNIQGRIEHDVKIISATPRPPYPSVGTRKVKVEKVPELDKVKEE